MKTYMEEIREMNKEERMNQEKYCKGCYFQEMGSCNVILTEKEITEGCLDRDELSKAEISDVQAIEYLTNPSEEDD